MSALQRGFESVFEQLGIWGPRILLGLVLLVVGWILARLLRRLATALAVRVGIDRPVTRLAAEGELPSVPPDRMPSQVLGLAVFWLALLFTAVSVLTMVRLETVALPFQTVLVRIGEWLPGLFASIVLVIIGWVVATLARSLVLRLSRSAKLDDRLADIGAISREAAERQDFANVIAVAVYALVLLLFLLPAVDALGLTIIAETLQNSLQMIANAIPGILAAIVVLGVAALVAFIVRPTVTRLVAATGLDAWGKHIGLDPERTERGATISGVLGQVAFWLIILFAFPAALDRLGLEPIVAPFREAWTSVILALPHAVAALGIAVAAVILARIIGPLVERMLHGVGFDNILGRIGLAKLQAASESGGERWLPSKLIGAVAALVIYLLMGQEALRVLGLEYLAALVNQLILYLPNILVAVAILVAALLIANVVANMVRQATSAMSDINSEIAAGVAYVAIVVFGAAMGVDQLKVGGTMVQNAVLLILAALCLAAAIALGLGIRPVVERWSEQRFAQWIERKPGSGG